MSTLKVNTLEEATVGGATFYTAKAWVNFTAYSSFSVRGSGNVSSVSDNGTGNFRVNYTNNLANSTYTALASAGNDATSYADGNQDIDHLGMVGALSTSSVYVFAVDADDGATDDPQYMGVTATLS